ncbi:MAG: hypothetical protein V2I33_19740 [Kangiellaceae bacterium]|jgi:hypothetical protein|nr:hypothetical protein [Kangiellaceae bacterium]
MEKTTLTSFVQDWVTRKFSSYTKEIGANSRSVFERAHIQFLANRIILFAFVCGLAIAAYSISIEVIAGAAKSWGRLSLNLSLGLLTMITVPLIMATLKNLYTSVAAFLLI